MDVRSRIQTFVYFVEASSFSLAPTCSAFCKNISATVPFIAIENIQIFTFPRGWILMVLLWSENGSTTIGCMALFAIAHVAFRMNGNNFSDPLSHQVKDFNLFSTYKSNAKHWPKKPNVGIIMCSVSHRWCWVAAIYFTFAFWYTAKQREAVSLAVPLWWFTSTGKAWIIRALWQLPTLRVSSVDDTLAHTLQPRKRVNVVPYIHLKGQVTRCKWFVSYGQTNHIES